MVKKSLKIPQGQSKKDRQCSGQKKKRKEQTTIYNTLHMKLKIHQHEPPH